MPLQGSFMTLKRVTGGHAQIHRLKRNHNPKWSVWLRMGSSLVAQMVKNPPTNAGDPGSVPASGRSPGGRHGNSLQCSCLENASDRGAWWAIATRDWIAVSTCLRKTADLRFPDSQREAICMIKNPAVLSLPKEGVPA